MTLGVCWELVHFGDYYYYYSRRQAIEAADEAVASPWATNSTGDFLWQERDLRLADLEARIFSL